MTDSGKPGKPKAGFPPFPPSLESPQKQRASHIPTASTTSPYLKERLSRAGLTAGPKTVISEGGPQQTAEVGQNHLPNAPLTRHHTPPTSEGPLGLQLRVGQSIRPEMLLPAKRATAEIVGPSKPSWLLSF